MISCELERDLHPKPVPSELLRDRPFSSYLSTLSPPVLLPSFLHRPLCSSFSLSPSSPTPHVIRHCAATSARLSCIIGSSLDALLSCLLPRPPHGCRSIDCLRLPLPIHWRLSPWERLAAQSSPPVHSPSPPLCPRLPRSTVACQQIVKSHMKNYSCFFNTLLRMVRTCRWPRPRTCSAETRRLSIKFGRVHVRLRPIESRISKRKRTVEGKHELEPAAVV